MLLTISELKMLWMHFKFGLLLRVDLDGNLFAIIMELLIKYLLLQEIVFTSWFIKKFAILIQGSSNCSVRDFINFWMNTFWWEVNFFLCSLQFLCYAIFFRLNLDFLLSLWKVAARIFITFLLSVFDQDIFVSNPSIL